jgi:hypothetical protein
MQGGQHVGLNTYVLANSLPCHTGSALHFVLPVGTYQLMKRNLRSCHNRREILERVQNIN